MQTRLLAALVSVLIVGCAAESYTTAKRQALEGTSAMITADRGLVFGERCGGGGFRIAPAANQESQLIPGWTDDQRIFFLSLPSGKYTIPVIFSTDGGHFGQPPLEFTVTAGKATYIGGIYPSWLRAGQDADCMLQWSSAVRSRKYLWTSTFSNRDWDVYVVSRPEHAVQRLRETYPQLDVRNYITDLAK